MDESCQVEDVFRQCRRGYTLYPHRCPTWPFPLSIGIVRASMYGVDHRRLLMAVSYARGHSRKAKLYPGPLQDGWRTDPNSRDLFLMPYARTFLRRRLQGMEETRYQEYFQSGGILLT
jgi:hypothetical protein